VRRVSRVGRGGDKAQTGPFDVRHPAFGNDWTFAYDTRGGDVRCFIAPPTLGARIGTLDVERPPAVRTWW
jgi:hypothetical protein